MSDAEEYPRWTTSFAVSLHDDVPWYKREAAKAAVLAYCDVLEKAFSSTPDDKALVRAYRARWS